MRLFVVATDGSEAARAYHDRDPNHRLSDKETIMIGKLPLLSFALVTALSSVAVAREPHPSQRAPSAYGNPGGSYGNYGNYGGRGNHGGPGGYDRRDGRDGWWA